MIQKLADTAIPPSRKNSASDDLLFDSPEPIFHGRWIDSIEEMEAHLPEWRRLANLASYPNYNFFPQCLLPAFKYLNQDGAKLLVIEAPTMAQHDASPVWCCALPVVPKKLFKLPFRAMEIWKHDQSFDSTPLVRNDCAEDALRFAFRFLRQEGIELLSADTVALQGPSESINTFGKVWKNAIAQETTAQFERSSFERACFCPMESHNAYVETHVSKSVRKNSGRLRRRLQDRGALKVVVSDRNSDYEKLTEQFLRIESSGWKGENGTALSCELSTKQYFESIIQSASAMGQVRFLSLELDGQPVAMLCDFYLKDRGFAYKTAFDDAFASFSPGVLAEVANIEAMHRYGVDYVDSCTEPDNQTINRIWGQRMQFQKTVLALKPGIASFAIRSMPTLKRWLGKSK